MLINDLWEFIVVLMLGTFGLAIFTSSVYQVAQGYHYDENPEFSRIMSGIAGFWGFATLSWSFWSLAVTFG